MKRNYITLATIALIACPTWAQQKQQTQVKDSTVNRTVVVEQDYTPDIVDAAKVNVLPKVVEPTVSKKEVEYATTWTPSNNIPATAMQAYVGQETQAVGLPGYVRLGYGNYGNLDLLANYLFTLSPKDKLNLNFKMDGMNGKIDMPYASGTDNNSWKARYYRTRANVDYLHQFNKVDLNVAGHFGLSNFSLPAGSIGKQKFTSGDIHLGVKSTDETLPLQFKAETNLMLYGKQNANNGPFNSIDETLIRTKGLVTGAIGEEQLIGIAVEMNNMLYQETPDSYGNQVFNNRTLLDWNPYYELNNDNWLLHLGAHVDFSFGYGKTLRVSPDITAQYVFSDSYILYAKATGGRQMNDLRQLEILNPYVLSTTPIVDTYEQLNTRIGFKTSPITGLWFNLYGGYQNLKDDLYPYEVHIKEGDVTNYLDFKYANTDNLHIGAEVSYAYKDLFSISAEGTYYRWSSDYKQPEEAMADANFSLLMKPEFNFGLHIEVHPISALRFNAGYQYQSRALADIPSLQQTIPAVNNLSVGASYEIFKGISAYVHINNLMNKKYQWYYTVPTEGINFLGGLSFQF